MKLSHSRAVTGFLIAAAAGYITIELLDWSRLLNFSTTGNMLEYFASRLIKLLLSLEISLLVWVTGRAALEKKDAVRLSIAFIFVFAADIAFFLQNNSIGTLLFAVAQIILIMRNGSGIVRFLSGPQAESNRKKLFLISASVLAVNGLMVLLLFVPHSSHPMFPLILGYSLILACSLAMGIAAPFIHYFPVKNARLIVAGVSCLYAGDVTVGLNIILPQSSWYIISTSLTWLFYLPAITLFALSGYRWEEKG